MSKAFPPATFPGLPKLHLLNFLFSLWVNINCSRIHNLTKNELDYSIHAHKPLCTWFGLAFCMNKTVAVWNLEFATEGVRLIHDGLFSDNPSVLNTYCGCEREGETGRKVHQSFVSVAFNETSSSSPIYFCGLIISVFHL